MTNVQALALLQETAKQLAAGHLQNALVAHVRAGNHASTFDFETGKRNALKSAAAVLRLGADLIEQSM